MEGEPPVWSFGYGSNMDMAALRAKKRVQVLGKSVKSGLRDIFRHGRLTGVKGYHDLKVAEAMS